MDKGEQVNRVLKNPFDSAWITLYIQPDSSRMFIVQTYEYGGIEHYVKALVKDFVPDNCEIPKPWCFRRVVIVEGNKLGIPLVNSHVVYFDSVPELRRTKCESRCRMHDVTWSKIGLMRSSSVLSCDPERVLERSNYLRAVSPKRQQSVPAQNKKVKNGGKKLAVTSDKPIAGTSKKGDVVASANVKVAGALDATDAPSKKRNRGSNKKKQQEDKPIGDKTANAVIPELKDEANKTVDPAELHLKLCLMSLNDALIDATSVGNITGSEIDPFASGDYMLSTDREGLARHVLVDKLIWKDLDSFPTRQNVVKFVRDSNNVAYYKV